MTTETATPTLDIAHALNLVVSYFDEGDNLESFAAWLATLPSHEDSTATADKANACLEALRECADDLSNEGF
jgi:hypothetical protein